jgi:indolepyruvate ferredoxin oxidoreductase alpha subunit
LQSTNSRILLRIISSKPKNIHMPLIKDQKRQFMLGNEAIAWAALESGVKYVAGYPGTPSTEVVQKLAKYAKQLDIHAEWSTNEKVASEGAAAAAIAGLYSLVAMKNAGLSVALDFFTHLSLTGLGSRGGAMLLIVCDDPDAHSSGDETDSRWLARFAYMPLVEPSTIEEARRLVHWAFKLSARFSCQIVYRSYTRLSHASSLVDKSEVHHVQQTAFTDDSVTLTPYLAKQAHARTLERLEQIKAEFEESNFNRYMGPENPEILIACSGSAVTCAQEALATMDLEDRVGILKFVTLWPFPRKWALKYLPKVTVVLVAEEVDPFLEVHVKSTLTESSRNGVRVYGKESGHIPAYGEINPDAIMSALAHLLRIPAIPKSDNYQEIVKTKIDPLLITRGLTWCPGCPHRASFYAIERALKADGRHGYITGDIGCYTLDVFPGGKNQINLLHAMGSGAGLACGLAQLNRYGYKQPVVSLCGDSTFFHATIPALINAVYNRSSFIQIVLDNRATAMTGFQAHPGTGRNAIGEEAPEVDIKSLCRAIGCRVTIADPFDIKATTKTIRKLLNEDQGVRVLILRRTCELVRMKDEKRQPYSMSLDQEICRGDQCRVCLTKFSCPGLVANSENKLIEIREDICSGCGVCVEICPFRAISKTQRL